MRARLALIVLGLVVVPTVVLSVLAGRALRNWELILQRRLQIDATAALHAVVSRVDGRLHDELQHVQMAMLDGLARGGQEPAMRAAARRLCATRPMVCDAYLYMNPWGLMYPPEAAAGDPASAEPAAARELLVAALRREIASGDASLRELRLRVNQAPFCFQRVSDSQGLYAGYRVSDQALAAFLDEALAALARGFVVSVRGPGLRMPGDPGPASAADVEVTDSFGEGGDVRVRPAALPGEELASAALPQPFETVRLRAYLADPDELRAAAAVRARVNAWAVVVLAAGVLVGAALALREAAAEVQRARSRSNFVIGVSHDLRTPLASMRMLVESLLLGHVREEEKRRQFLATVLRECERLSQLVERVLFFVRFGQNALAHGPRALDPGPLVRSAVEAVRARFTGTEPGGVPRIDVATAGSLPPILADEAAMMQVLLNLLDNALKYGAPAAGSSDAAAADRPRVVVELQRASLRRWRRAVPAVRISVRDFGPGIERRLRRRIFRPFYRSPDAVASHVSGVGLGLAVCRRVVRMHGGRIRVESAPGEGSVFHVDIPATEE